jgi:hypothetical protein
VSLDATGLLSDLPSSLRNELVAALGQIENNYRERRWEPSELNGGKLCEVVYSILRGHVDGSYPTSASKPPNMVDACRSLEQASGFPRSIRIQIPRMLIALYEIRNNRGVGHVGGDVEPNAMDAICVLQMSKWVVGELIRVFHNVEVEEATAAVEALSEREITLVWKINGTSRVLNTDMSMLDKTMVLLYGEPQGMEEQTLFASLEHSNASIYRRDVLRRAHKRRLLEYDAIEKKVYISPLGVQHVEERVLA